MVQDNGVTARCGSVEARLRLDELGLRMDVVRAGTVILDSVRLGVVIADESLERGARLVRTTEHEVRDTWTARSGKSAGAHQYIHSEKVLHLVATSGLEWQLRVRVSDDGVAIRYRIVDLQGLSRFEQDSTAVSLPADSRTWVLDYQTWYETPRRGVDLSELPEGEYGFPFLARVGTGDQHVLITEADIDGRFSGAHAVVGADRSIRFALAEASVEIARGDITPWRVFLVGTTAEIIESLLVDELSPPASSELADADWIRPGRAAWSWWSDFYSGAQFEQQKHFVDVAAQFGWEHLLIDCGWEETWVPEIVAYASLRGIQVHLWTVWHDLDGPTKLARLELWRSWGVAGIKVDFMESEAKDRYRWYDSVLIETARLGMMVNFHGSVIPRGWARTWPQVIGYEAIRGSEYYVFYNDTPLTASHNVIQPFTRNVVGAMDYTPVAFTAPGRSTSDAHELGLSVAFECGITHFADGVDAYLARPLAARFLAELAPTWDETVLLAGTPDTEAVVARRSGDRWFIGGIATGDARTISVPLHRLGLGTASAWVIEDASPGGLRERIVNETGPLEIQLSDNGGFVAIVGAAGSELFRARPRPIGTPPQVSPALAELDTENSALLTVSADAALRLPAGWTAAKLGAGSFRVTAPATLPSGELGVITVEEPGEVGVPRVAHARFIAPLTSGEHRISVLPMLSFTNQSGPVERDMSNGGGNPLDGARLTVAGSESDDGFGVSTPSTIQLHLGRRATRLRVSVGIDDETPTTTAVVRVHGDGAELARHELVAGTPPTAIDLDVAGVRFLTLESAAATPGAEPAHVDWLSGRVVVADDLHTTPPPGR